MREYSERFGQLLLRKIFRRPTNFNGLRHRNTEIFRLFNKPSRRHFVRFGRVNEIKTKQVFLLADTHMKAVAVIGWVCNETAILQNNPMFGSVTSRNMDCGAANNSNGDDRSQTDSREDRKAKDQSATSNWLIL